MFVLGLSAVLFQPLHVVAQDSQGIVKAYFFYSATCPGCKIVRQNVIPPLYQQFAQQLHIKAIEVSNEENYRWLQACEEAYGIPAEDSAVPIIFIGDQYVVGGDIQDQLPGLIEQYAAQGGTEYPDVPAPEGIPQPTVRFMFFFSPTCPHCQNVEENVLPQIRQKYGNQVQWEAYDTTQEVNLRALMALGNMVGLPQDQLGSVPVVFIGDEYAMYSFLRGEVEIGAFLEPAIEWFLDVGGVGLPGWTPELFEFAANPLPEETPTATPSEEVSPEIHVAYFAEPGCTECDRVGNILKVVENRFPGLVVHEFDIVDDLAINHCLSQALGVPENQQHDAPAIFVGDDFLVDKNIQLDPLIEILNKYADEGVAPVWTDCEQDGEVPPPAPWWAVIVPGLIDGINPCAFATIVFFVSYLSLIGRKGRDILMVGLSFTVAVFMSYLGFGLVLRQVLSGLIDLVGPILKPILNILTAVVCIVLAILSLSDYNKARRGRTKGMALRLPDKLRRWINATIRKSMQAGTSDGRESTEAGTLNRLVVASFVAGVVVSFVELTCTGQVYAPIILGLSNPEYQGQALLSLVIYCLAFVVPLIVVFFVSFMGTSSQQLGQVLNRHTATVKLITAILFVAISLWLIYDVLRMWGTVASILA